LTTEASRTIAIVGGGQAAGAALVRLRQLGFAGRVVMVGGEVLPPYERPPLSKSALLDEAPLPRPVFAGAAPNEAMFTGFTVDALDVASRSVRFAARALDYDRLLLATGARPRMLDVMGAGLEGIHCLRTMDDARRVNAALRACRARDRALLIVGGSWIGLEVAAAARALGVKVVLVERGTRLCRRTAPEAIAQRLHDLHLSHGVEIRFNVEVVAFGGEAGVRNASLSDGSSLEIGAAVVGIGVIPNTALAEAAGLRVRRGIVVDGSARTSDPHIHAAGDVAETHCAWRAGWVCHETWSSANAQGALAAESMVRELRHGPVPAPARCGAPWFWSDQYGRTLQFAGAPLLADTSVVVAEDENGFVQSYHAAGRLVGAAAIGHARAFRALRRAVDAAIP
jgi:3-phenylpropionate/trans-cinnamate dioxygenase ferredoxin reductase subunit